MIFTDDVYTYIPEDYLAHSSPYVDEYGNNTPLYNHKYWEEHKDTIMARRRFLRAGADKDPDFYDYNLASKYLEDLGEDVEYYIQKNKDTMTAGDAELLRKELDKEAERIMAKTKDKPKLQDASATGDSDSSSKKKKKGSSSGSSSGSGSGSSKSSSSSKGKAGGTENDGSHSKSKVTASASPIKSGAQASKEKSEKATKEKAAAKEKSGSGKEKASAEKNSKNANDTKNQAPSEDNSEMSVAFSKIKETGYEAGQEPVNSYASFIRELRQSSSYQVDDPDTGLALWREYRKRKGMDTSDALLEKHRSSAEEDILRRKTLQHGLDVFDAAVLEHHGILGMHWGVQNGPPYPLDANAHSQSEKKANWQQSLSRGARRTGEAIAKGSKAVGRGAGRLAKGTADTIRKQRVAAIEKKQAKATAKKEAEEEAKRVERRDAIARGDYEYAQKHFNDMSSQEVNDLISRIDLKAKLDTRNPVPPKVKKTFNEQVKTISDSLNVYKTAVGNGIDAWNNFAKLYNSFADEKLPIIDGDRAKRLREDFERQQAEYQKNLYQQILNDPSLKTPANLAKLDDTYFNSIMGRDDKINKHNKDATKDAREAAEARAKALAKDHEEALKENAAYDKMVSDAWAENEQRKEQAKRDFETLLENAYRENRERDIAKQVDDWIKDPSLQTPENFAKQPDDFLKAYASRQSNINAAKNAAKGDVVNSGGGNRNQQPKNNQKPQQPQAQPQSEPEPSPIAGVSQEAFDDYKDSMEDYVRSLRERIEELENR